ncbi:MAG: hypothetical protein ACTHK5_03685 [Tsuneonella sp.]
MNDPAIAVGQVEFAIPEPQDRGTAFTFARIASLVLSLLVIAAALGELRHLRLADISALVPTSPLFWGLFALAYLTGPLSEFVIYRRLWGVGAGAFGALLRKLVYNELIVGYLGEVFFYSWARRNLALTASPFGAVKDVAVLSAVAGNVMTLAFLAIAAPLLRLIPLGEHASAIEWSLALVMLTSVVVMFARGAIFSLTRRELWFVASLHVARIAGSTALTALLWHMVLPGVNVAWWLLLATLRMLISRLPFVPNKDIVFAGVAVLAVGRDVQIAALMAMMAALVLLTHILVGVTFALFDLLTGERDAGTAG